MIGESQQRESGGLEGDYTVAFLGDPSDKKAWMLQIRGHHLAVNRAYHTRQPGATPRFTGIESGSYPLNSRMYAVMEGRLRAVSEMLHSLHPDQLAAAQLKDSFKDVLLGPGKDGHFPEPEGIPYSHLDETQQRLVKRSIISWVGDADPRLSAALLRDYLDKEALARTYIAWSGSIDDLARMCALTVLAFGWRPSPKTRKRCSARVMCIPYGVIAWLIMADAFSEALTGRLIWQAVLPCFIVKENSLEDKNAAVDCRGQSF